MSAASYYFESMRDNVTSGVDAGGGLGWRCSLVRAGGGIVVDGGLHWIRPLRELCGNIRSVVGATRRGFESDALQLEGESLAHALFRFDPPSAARMGEAHAARVRQKTDEGGLIATYSASMVSTAPMAYDTG